jgi:hypothetical protein
LIFGLAACSSTSQHALIANPVADASGLLNETVTFREVGPVEGRACRYFLIALIPFGNSSLGNAIKNALMGTPADAILNASVTTSLYGFVPIYNVLSFTCTTVQGVAVSYE